MTKLQVNGTIPSLQKIQAYAGLEIDSTRTY
jgi:hypothetical protein